MSKRQVTPYREDALILDEEVRADEVLQFLETRVEDPIERDQVTIWNFNNHQIHDEALDHSIDSILYDDEFVIPYQMATTWGMMNQLLPKKIRETTPIIYNSKRVIYQPLTNYAGIIDDEKQVNFKAHLTRMAEGIQG